ncbi:MFS transporter [Altererythrobacter xixiisoli]|uniref:MFS transporter n=1 Tax=Croceibacterium xixiisoli TaxID=1476466 RepID=A0A6I4TRE3_9SPHN|nr:MFS transporter [Croceibacterium xixiisoli]MXO97701.1 MFS transporter [Croceibacterium xixiisoli]
MTSTGAIRRVGLFSAPMLSAPARSWPIGAAITMVLGALMTSLFTRSFGIALADIRGAYGLSIDEGAWLSTITNAAQLITAPAIPMAVAIFGPRPVLGMAGGAFVLSTLLAPLATAPWMVFALHLTMGVALGCFVPAALALIFANLPPRYWLIALGLYSARLTFALHGGVSSSGWMVETLGWQAIYWLGTALGVAFLLLAHVSFARQPMKDSLWARTNKGEVAMFCLGLTLIFTGLDQGNRLDWLESGVIVVLLAGGLILLAGAVIWQFLSPLPFAHPDTMLKHNVFLALAISLCFAFTTVATSLLIPGFLATIGHLKAVQSGAALFWIDAVQIAVIPLSIWTIRRGYLRLTLAGGFVLVMAGCWLGADVTHLWRGDDFALASALIGAGNGAVLLTFIALAIANSRREELVNLAAYIQIVRIVGPEFGLAMVSTFLRKQEAAHATAIGLHIDLPRLAALVKGESLATLAATVSREAHVLAIADGYRLCLWAALTGLALTLFLKRTPPHPLARFEA